MLRYYLHNETPSKKWIIDARGASYNLTLVPGKAWMTDSQLVDWNREVRNWRAPDQDAWIQQYVWPTVQVIDDAICGTAFADTANQYPTLPNYESASKAFKIGMWVFVPDGIEDPRSGEVVSDGGATPTFDLDFDDEPEDGAEEPVAGPSALSTGVKVGIAAVLGTLAGFVTYMLIPGGE